jgi:SNF2 family DNA or RNA helicase
MQANDLPTIDIPTIDIPAKEVTTQEVTTQEVTTQEVTTQEVTTQEVTTQETPLITPRPDITYLPHQEHGIRWMIARESATADVCRGGILADDMGLGKTFQTIGLLLNSPCQFRTLIVCPPPLVATWAEELSDCRFAVQVLKGRVWVPYRETPTGSESPKSAIALKPRQKVYLTTYNKVSQYWPNSTKTFVSPAVFPRVILDEGHVIRNGASTSRWRHCMYLASRATCRWILSATPIQNGINDWNNLCRWLSIRGPTADFIDYNDVIMLRRTMADLRGDIKALPPPPIFHEHELQIPEDEAEGRLFQQLCNQFGDSGSRSGGSFATLELFMRIQQFLVHPQLYIERMREKLGRGAYPRPDWTGTATKWTAATDHIQAAITANRPVIVFCQFRQEMDMVRDFAIEHGANTWSIRGGMKIDEIRAAVTDSRAAAAANKPVVIVVQIVAGGVGLNLQFCKEIVFLSQHWNPAVVHQAVGRAVRIGQKDRVIVHTYNIVDGVLENIDRKMMGAHEEKIDTARDVCSSFYEGYLPMAVEFDTYEGEEEEADTASTKTDDPQPVS